jgi:hypothetical protein
MVTMGIRDRTLETDVELEYLKPHIGKLIDINGRLFELFITRDMGGDFVTWGALDGSYIVYATINYDNCVGVPVELCDSDGCTINDEFYPCILDEANWFCEYCGIVKATAGKLIADYEIKNNITCAPATDYALNVVAGKVLKIPACHVDLELSKNTHYGLPVMNLIRSSNGEFKQVAIGTPEQVREAMIEFLEENMHIFCAEGIAKYTKAGCTDGMIRAIEILSVSDVDDADECLFNLLDDVDSFIASIANQVVGGYGEYLSNYNTEDIIEFEGVTYFAYII